MTDGDRCSWAPLEDGHRWQCVLTHGHDGAHLTTPFPDPDPDLVDA
jgi:hypothetical protein